MQLKALQGHCNKTVAHTLFLINIINLLDRRKDQRGKDLPMMAFSGIGKRKLSIL